MIERKKKRISKRVRNFFSEGLAFSKNDQQKKMAETMFPRVGSNLLKKGWKTKERGKNKKEGAKNGKTKDGR